MYAIRGYISVMVNKSFEHILASPIETSTILIVVCTLLSVSMSSLSV